MEFSTPRDASGRPCLPTHHPRSRLLLTNSASSPHPVPGLLERLAEVRDPRDPSGVRHALAAVLTLSAGGVVTGATSLLVVGEWIADALRRVLELLGIRRAHAMARGECRCRWTVPPSRHWHRDFVRHGRSLRYEWRGPRGLTTQASLRASPRPLSERRSLSPAECHGPARRTARRKAPSRLRRLPCRSAVRRLGNAGTGCLRRPAQ
ncbi:transposase family protein [Streptomyces sp. NPDC058286]|uniref:transposase family protein n=1 Tax=Streptomyces sp. NPDC058286 TaxID=3346422 RepID=UPI0036E1C505